MSTRAPRHQPAQFVASGWESGTPERKAWFVNALLRFIEADCPRERFTRSLYDGLSNHGYFGFIAHYTSTASTKPSSPPQTDAPASSTTSAKTVNATPTMTGPTYGAM